LLLLFCDSSGSKDTHCRHISKFAGEIITGAILTGAIITDTIDRNRHCITNTIDRNEYSHLILALRRTSGKNKRAGYMQGEFIYHNMSNSAVNANGILKDASEIEWFHDPDDDMPISPHPESSSKALPPGPRTLDSFIGSHRPATVVAGSRRSGRWLSGIARQMTQTSTSSALVRAPFLIHTFSF
jgi:hypothetical protein